MDIKKSKKIFWYLNYTLKKRNKNEQDEEEEHFRANEDKIVKI